MRARPFYAEFAWAYDLLIDRPVRKECRTIAAWLVARGVRPGASVLDAGCGTGRYAIELARRGYVVHGIDRSAELLAVATRAPVDPAWRVSFERRDLSRVPAARHDAVLCRGALNDLVDDAARHAAVGALRRALHPGGALVCDVREWAATADRKAREPLFRKRVATDRGTLTFTSVTALDVDTRRLLVTETHTLDDRGRARSREFQFVMRCWTRHELESALAHAGFGDVAYFGAYDRDVAPGATDRLVAVASAVAQPALSRRRTL